LTPVVKPGTAAPVEHQLLGKENEANYTKDRTPDDDMLRPLFGNGLLTSNGAEWAAQRRMCAPGFRATAVDRFDQVIVAAAEHLVRQR
jgi:cytochrome P450